MTTVTATTLPAGPWTARDLDAFPTSPTVRYELVDGALLVTSEPTLQHQRVAGSLFRQLQDSAPADLEVFLPVDVRLSPLRQIAPDVTVVRREHASAPRLSGLPLLAVEVQSPSTRVVDLVLKRQVLQEAGVPSYWLVEPDTGTITTLELQDGEYVQTARGRTVVVERPFPVTISL